MPKQSRTPHQSPENEQAQSAPRDPTFDIVKGIGILEVIIHHVTSHSARKFTVAGDFEWWLLTITNRIFHFAVPLFLLASALLLARSVARKPRPDWKRFMLRRGERTVWPYLIWTVVYWFFRIRFVKMGSDIYPTPVTLPWGAEAVIYGLFAHPALMLKDVLWGKAYYHLYFMAVLIQFSLIFPLLYSALRKAKIGFGTVLAIAFGLQVGVYYAQYHWWRVESPGSIILWYLPPVLTGMWLGLNWSKWPRVWRNWRRWITAAAVLAGTAYLVMSVRIILQAPVNTRFFSIAVQVFTLGIALLFLHWAGLLARGSTVGRWLARIGDKSLPLFLMHPAVMFLISGPRITAFISRFHLESLVTLFLTLVVTWGLTWLISLAHLDELLFGRRFDPRSFRFGSQRSNA